MDADAGLVIVVTPARRATGTVAHNPGDQIYESGPALALDQPHGHIGHRHGCGWRFTKTYAGRRR